MEENKREVKAMHAYLSYPTVKFDGQGPDEIIILLLRAHPITQLPWIFNSIFLMIIFAALNIFYPIFLSMTQIIFINIFLFAFLFSYIWFNFLNWYFNVGIITNKRVVDVDFTNILYKEVTATRLDKIEDVTSKAGGYFKSLFNYGDVFVQTAGTEANIEFVSIPFPSQVVRVINDLMPQ